ncbi:MAG: peroxiredoxin [Ectothiorhodospiraceae bacterium AqS1]|nr:peroxiredoxin [Ectothiorhodospiraceae bacterium AqS1]
MAIEAGSRIPEATFGRMTPKGPSAVSSDEIFAGRKVVVFAVPGAFTPSCSAAHLPGFVANADKIKAKGVDEIVCISVNDPFVMDAWGRQQNAEEIAMLADGSGNFTRAAGMELDLRDKGLGVRSQRYAMVVDDGAITHLMVEDEPPKVEKSSAESVLSVL